MVQRSIYIFSVFLLFFMSVSAQKLAPGKYWIQLTDKNNSPYSPDQPEEFLSKAAIERRQNYKIPINEEDIPVSKKYSDSLNNLGLEIIGASKWFNAVIAATDDTLLLSSINDLDFVRDFNYSQSFTYPSGGIQSYKENTQLNELPNFPSSGTMTDYGQGLQQISVLNGKALHDLGYRGQGIKIALLDAGFYNVNVFEAFRHLWYDNRITAVKDFVRFSEHDLFSESTHGMSALSTIAAYISGSFIGTAPEAEFMLLRSEDVSSEYKIEEVNWLLAAEYADSAGADIISTSLGYNEFNDSAMNYVYNDLDGNTALVTLAAEIAFSKGIIVIASAGNEGNKTWKQITPPSDGKNVISVGSIDINKSVSAFSSRGPTFDGRIKPDVLAVGYETVLINSSGSVSRGFGTSFAAPQISGLTACLWQAYRQKTNKEIIQAIRKSSSRYENPDNNYGYGIPNFMHAFHHLYDYEDSSKKIWIFPNPFNENFNLYFDIPVEEIQIIDIYGKIIKSYKVDLQAFELKNLIPSELEPGMYILLGKNSAEFRVTRIVRQ